MEKLHPTLFREVLSKNPILIKNILVLTPEEGSKFMAAAHLTWQQRRDMLSMMKRLRGSVLFGSEAKQREYESTVTSLVSTEKLQIEKMILYSTSQAEFPTLCASVKVRDLAPYFASIVHQAYQQDWDKESLQNPDHPSYNGKLRVAIGGDKGGKVMRWTAEIASNSVHIFGMFEADDSHSNLEKFMASGGNWEEQLRYLLVFFTSYIILVFYTGSWCTEV